MIRVTVRLKVNREPVKRIPVELRFDTDGTRQGPQVTDRDGVACFDAAPGSGKILVNGAERFHGRLAGDILVELWSIIQSDNASAGAPDGIGGGSIEYPNMQTRALNVEGFEVLTDSEGYLVRPADWSEDFVRAQAAAEGLTLDDEHWEIIRYLRAYYEDHGAQASVRDMIRYFRETWGRERGNNAYLHRIFPMGGPQKQGNRLAGLLRTKGEH